MSTKKNTTDGASTHHTFADRLSALEAIVKQMESGELPLEAAMSAYAEGSALLNTCQSALQQAEQTVLQLNQQQQLVPLDPQD